MFYKLEGHLEYSNFAEEILFNTLKRLQVSKERVINIALSGGQTPLPILKILKERDLNWRQFSFFMVDERCVPSNNPLSNFGNIHQVFFNFIDSNNYSMVQPGLSFSHSAKEYSKLLHEVLIKDKKSDWPKFDLVLLGMGEDGHTASLFPNTKALDEKKELVVINNVPQLNTQRITLTFPVLWNADKIFVLVKGQRKREIIDELYTGHSPNYPIYSVVKNHSNLNWIID